MRATVRTPSRAARRRGDRAGRRRGRRAVALRLELALLAVLVVASWLLAGPVGAAVAAAWSLVVVLAGLVVPLVASRAAAGAASGAGPAGVLAGVDGLRAAAGAARPRAEIPAGELVRVRASRGSRWRPSRRARKSWPCACRCASCACARPRRCRDRDGDVGAARSARGPGVGAVAAPDARRLSLWEPIPVGVDELGDTVTIALPERNVLLGGEPGAGKCAALSLLVATAALDPSVRLWLLDGKLVELSVWAPCAERLAGPDIDEAIALLRDLRDGDGGALPRAARARPAQDHPRRRAGAAPGRLRRAGVLPGREDRKQRIEFAELLRDLVARGRAAGVIVCAATQKPASDVVPSALRDLFGFRLALRCNTPQASDTILGQGWASAGYSAGDDPTRPARCRAPAGRGRPARPYARLPSGRRADRRDRRARRGVRADAWLTARRVRS